MTTQLRLRGWRPAGDRETYVSMAALHSGRAVGSCLVTLTDIHHHLMECIQSSGTCSRNLAALGQLTGWTWVSCPHGYQIFTRQWAIYIRIPELADELTALLARRKSGMIRFNRLGRDRLKITVVDVKGTAMHTHTADVGRLRQTCEMGAACQALLGCKATPYEDGFYFRPGYRHEGAQSHLYTTIWIPSERLLRVLRICQARR